MSILVCASTMASDIFAADAPEASSSGHLFGILPPITGDDLLQGQTQAPDIDINWMLRDTRQTLPDGFSMVDFAPIASMAQRLSMGSPSHSVLPPVQAPSVPENLSKVNDMLVPVPVLSVGWSIVLSAILFHIGAQMLRLRKRVAA